MNFVWLLWVLRHMPLQPLPLNDVPGQVASPSKSSTPGQTQVKQKPDTIPPDLPIVAFPDSPKMPQPRVKDLQVPPAPVTPGSLIAPDFQADMPLGVEEAIQIALHRQPSLGAKIGAFQLQQGQTWELGANLHPQVYLGAGVDLIQPFTPVNGDQPAQAPTLSTPPGVSPVFAYNLTVYGKQLLYDFNMTRNLVRQSEALEESARHNLTVAQQELILSVATAFYNYADATRQVAVNDANVVNRQRQLDLANAQLKAGSGEPGDLATAESSKAQAILQLNVARNTAEADRILLLQQMGVDPLTPVIPSMDAAPTASSTDAHVLTDTAIRLRPEVKSAAEALAAARYGLSAAKATNLPAIYAEIGAGLTGNSLPPDNGVGNLSVGFEFPIFDGGYRRGAVKEANGQLTTADSTLKTAVLQVRTDVATAYMTLRSAEQRMAITDNEVLNAQEDVRIAEGRYSAGVGLFLDITTAQALLVTAMTDQESARNALDLARTNLRHATGELLKDIHSGL